MWARVASWRGLTRAVTVVVAGSCASTAGADCLYSVTVIQGPSDPIFGPPVTIPLGLNDAGDVVGYWCPVGGESPKAFLWTAQSGLITLPMPPGTVRSAANDISNAGHICGWFDVFPDSVLSMGFVYDGKTFVPLGIPPGGNFSEAMAVNSAGQAVGCWGNSGTGQPALQAFFWDGDQLINLGPALATPNGCANDISERGVVVGWKGQAPQIDAHAYVWHDGKVSDLGVIPGGYTSEAAAINELGDVVGRGFVIDSECTVPVWHAFLYTEGQMLDLGILPGHRRSRALGVNESQQVAGLFDGFPGCSVQGPFIWENNAMADLNALISPALGITIQAAWAINSGGQIAAYGGVGGDPAALLLTPPKRPVGDVDGDCEVGFPDIELLFASWGPCADCAADLNSDQLVNIVDFLLLLSNWG